MAGVSLYFLDALRATFAKKFSPRQRFQTPAKAKTQKKLHAVIKGLPLGAMIVANLMPIKPAGHQALVGTTLIWFQVFMLSEVFTSPNRKFPPR